MAINPLVTTNRNAILALASAHGVRNVRMFGSMARDDAGMESDVDLLVDLEVNRSLLDLGALLMDLQDLLGRKVDIVTESSVHWCIRDRVLEDAVPL